MRYHSAALRFIILVISIPSYIMVNAQDSVKIEKKIVLQNMVDSEKFVFQPQTMLPLRGGARQITSYYDITVSKDSIISNLPYFGRAYSAAINPSENGLNFTLTHFAYSNSPNKKGGWDVIIKPRDQGNIQQLIFNIYNNGRASLNVISTNRDAVNFEGILEKKKKK